MAHLTPVDGTLKMGKRVHLTLGVFYHNFKHNFKVF